LNPLLEGRIFTTLSPAWDMTASLMKTCAFKEDETPESTSEEDRCV
jgi:hypothetical protein